MCLVSVFSMLKAREIETRAFITKGENTTYEKQPTPRPRHDAMSNELSQFSIVPRIVWQGCQPTEIKVYCALASYVDWDTGTCWPSRATIADALTMSVGTIDRALSGLVKAGAIEIDKRKRDRGDHDSNLYTLPFAINRKASGGVAPNMRPPSPKSDRGVAPNMTGRTRTIEQEGLTLSKLDPNTCRHAPMDGDGYCTACDTEVKVEVSA